MHDVALVPTPKYVPNKWETTDLGEFVQYDPKFFAVVQIPDKQKLGLKCIKCSGKIPQPVGLTDYSYMFSGSSIQTIDMTGWDFSKVTSMAAFFMNCKKLDRVKCGALNFSQCVYFNKMFYNCDDLVKIDVDDWVLDEVSDCNFMFAECNKLKQIDFAHWNTTKLDECTAMFENCISLRSVDCSSWFTPDLNSANRMFKGCINLRSANIRFNNIKGLRDLDRIFMDCRSLKSVVMPDLTESENATLYLAFDGTPNSVRPQEYADFMSKRAVEKSAHAGNAWFG